MPALTSLLFDSRRGRAMQACALVLFAGVVIAGSVPGARAEVGEYAPGYVLHGATYAFLALLWFLGSSGNAATRALKAVLAIAMMGAVDELVQSFLPYRSGDVRDWLVDVTAATLASTLLAVCMPRPVQARSR